MPGFRHWKWHVDEVYVRINGETHYLWRAVDHEGEVLESYVTKTRDKSAALHFLKKALKRHGKAEATRARDAAISADEVTTKVRIRPCFDIQSFPIPAPSR